MVTNCLRNVARALTILVVALGAACTEPLAPRDLAGEFALVAPMPTVVSDSLAVRVLADTLTLNADRSASRRVWVERWRLAGNDTTPEVVQETYTYRIEGDSIGLLWECPAGQNCAAVALRWWYEIVQGGVALRPRQQREVLYRRIRAAVP